MRQLTIEEIESLIDEDKIVWVSCRKPAMPLLQGKFSKSPKPLEGDDYHYCFCPYKRGYDMPFLAAENWHIVDDDSKKANKNAIEDVMKHFKKK